MKHTFLMGISVLPALLIMPAMGDTVTTRHVITDSTTYNNLTATNIASTTSNNGGVFYMQNVPNAVLTLNGVTVFTGNSLNGGGMGGVIGNGWLSSASGVGYTVGGKIVFTGDATFASNSTNNPNGGGAIFNYGTGTATNPDIMFVGNTVFESNSSTGAMNTDYTGGGAIYHRDGAIVFQDAAAFRNNSSATKGGAIITGGDIVFADDTVFVNNSAASNGGAISVLSGNILFADGATFSGNTAGSGSAIFISGPDSNLTFTDTASFVGNTGDGTLWNNGANAKVTFRNGAIFDSNTNPLNGSLINAGIITGTGGDYVFSNNTGSNGGGLKNAGIVTLDTTGKIVFSGNRTTSSAGALDNGGTVTFDASSVTFVNNQSSSGYGGAIFNAGDMQIFGATNNFSNNTAADTGTIKSGGGAIHNRGRTGDATMIIGTTTSVNTFASNVSGAYGGAIVSRAFDGTGQNASLTINGTTTFANNKSALDGGAIWNVATESDGTIGTTEITFNGDVSFLNNRAGGLGGALYNNDTVTFNQSAVFNGNTANGVANDIYNDGTVNFNANASLSGGVAGNGTLNIADGATVNIGSTTISQGAINLDGTLMATLRAGQMPQINVANTGGFTGDGTIKLSFDSAGTYYVFGNQTFANTDISSSIYDLTWNGGNVTATIKSVADIASQNNLSNESARTIANVSQSSSSQLNNLSVLIQENLATDTPRAHAAVEHATRSINPEIDAVPQSSALASHNAINAVVSNRLMGGNYAYMYGRSAGDVSVAPGGIWIQGVYNKSKLNNSFNGYTRGLSVGFDGTIDNDWTLGMGYLYAHSNVAATSRDTEIDAHSVFAYGRYQPNDWYVNAIVNYTLSDYSETGNALGLGVGADYDMDAFGAMLETGYDFFGGITPTASLRYLHLGSADYTNSLGVRSRISGTDYLTASVGTRYGFEMLLNNGWLVRPDVHYALQYDLMADEHHITVAMPGINAYVLDGNRLSRIANTVGLGLEMMYGALNISLAYDIESRMDYTSQTGRVKFRYEF